MTRPGAKTLRKSRRLGRGERKRRSREAAAVPAQVLCNVAQIGATLQAFWDRAPKFKRITFGTDQGGRNGDDTVMVMFGITEDGTMHVLNEQRIPWQPQPAAADITEGKYGNDV